MFHYSLILDNMREFFQHKMGVEGQQLHKQSHCSAGRMVTVMNGLVSIAGSALSSGSRHGTWCETTLLRKSKKAEHIEQDHNVCQSSSEEQIACSISSFSLPI